MSKKQTQPDKKRYGQRGVRNKRFMKVYWPYLPGALLLVLTLSLLWLTPSGRTAVLGYATNISIDGLLSATNAHRARHNAGDLTLNSRLTDAAQAKAQDMVERDYWSHTTPDGKESWVFLHQAGYAYKKAGENLAYGFSDSNSVVAGWMNSPSHRANLLDVAYSEVGFGIANSPNFVNDGPATIVVALYGAPLLRAEPSFASAPNATTDDAIAITSDSTTGESPTRPVALVETLTGGSFPWAFFAVGLVSGSAASAMLFRHGVKLRRLLTKSERFVLHHPIIDTGLILVVIAGLLLSTNVGFIK